MFTFLAGDWPTWLQWQVLYHVHQAVPFQQKGRCSLSEVDTRWTDTRTPSTRPLSL